MSFYNAINDNNPFFNYFLGILDIDINKIERFRDTGYFEDVIWIYTRTGGHNRKQYQNKILLDNKYYLHNDDDKFDDTYAIYFFKLPEFAKKSIKYLKETKPIDWAKTLKEYNNNPDKYINSPIFKQLKKILGDL